MKLCHLSDLHLGLKLHEVSMLEDQRDMLQKLVSLVQQKQPEAVMICGDVYDRSVPSAEAVELFDDFLTALAKTAIPVLLISGNHDSAERLQFGSKLFSKSGIHIAAKYDGTIPKITLQDEFGPVNFYLLPFVKPAVIRYYLQEEVELSSYHEAVKYIIDKLEINAEERNVLLAHQFITGAAKGGSEDVSVGGLDNIGAEVFAKFDYVALGHIHGAQKIGSEKIYYCGTPLKYSFAEAGQQKAVTMVELGPKGDLKLHNLPLESLHDLRKIKGSYAEVTNRKNYEGTAVEDYLHITLTDEVDIPDAMNKLRTIYPNALALEYERKQKQTEQILLGGRVEQLDPLELFREFYKLQNNAELQPEQVAILQDVLELAKKA